MITTTTRPILGMKQINKNTLQVVNSSGTTMQCNSNQFIFFSLTTLIEGFSSYPEVKLRFKRIPSSEGKIRLYKANVNYLVSLTSYSTKMITIDGSTWFEADITDAFIKENKEAVYFAICLESGVSATVYNESSGTSNAPQLIVSKIEKTKNVKYQKHLSGSSSDSDLYNVNLRTGELTYSINLMNIESNHLPLNLMLNYDERNLTNSTVNGSISTKFPIGWRLNYQQFIYASGSDYIYVDGNNIKHTFVLANNLDSSSTNKVYFDQDGTYLTLKINSESNFEIRTADENQILTFNSSGYLINIKQLVSNNCEYNVNLYYNSNNQLISIEKANGDSFAISYESTNKKIIIDSVGGKRAILLYDSDNLLTSVQLPNGSTTEFTYTTNDSTLLSRAVVPIIPSLPELPEILENRLATIVTNNKKIKFLYLYNIESIKEIRELYFDDEDEYPEVHYSLTYSKHQTTVKMTPNSTGISNLGRLTNVFTFNEEGELIRENELINNNLESAKLYIRDEHYNEVIKQEKNNIYYTVSYDDIIDGENKISSGNVIYFCENLSVGVEKNYYVYVSYYSAKEISNFNNSIFVEITEFNNNIGDGESVTKEIPLPKGTYINQNVFSFKCSNPNVRIYFSTNSTEEIIIKKCSIYEDSGEELIMCSNCKDNDDKLIAKVNNVSYYKLLPFDKSTYTDSNSVNQSLSNVRFNFNDLIINQENYYNAIKNGNSKYNIFYNSGKGMLTNVSNVNYGITNKTTTKAIENLKLAKINDNSLLSSVQTNEYELIENDTNYEKIKKVILDYKEYKGTSFSSTYRYDSYNNLIKYSDDSLLRKDYTNMDGNVIEEKVNNDNDNYQTLLGNLDKDLKSVSNYYNDRINKQLIYYKQQEIGKKYEYDNIGRIEKIFDLSNPSLIEQQYIFNANKLCSIKFFPSDELVESNDIIYNNQNIISIKRNTNNLPSVEFTYDNMDRINSIKMYGYNHLEKEITYNEGLMIENLDYYGYYRNKNYYDKYGRIIKNSMIITDEDGEEEKIYKRFLYGSKVNSANFTDDYIDRHSDPLRAIIDEQSHNMIKYEFDDLGRKTRKDIMIYNSSNDDEETYNTFDVCSILYSYLGQEVPSNEKEGYKLFSGKTRTHQLNDITVFEKSVAGKVDDTSKDSINNTISINKSDNEEIIVNENNVLEKLDRIYKKDVALFIPGGYYLLENRYSFAKGENTDSSSYFISNESIKYGISSSIEGNKTYANISINYEYDNKGNIIEIEKTNVKTGEAKKITYSYDKYNQLIRENNEELNRTYIITYDEYGNMLTKKEYPYSNNDILSQSIKVNEYYYQYYHSCFLSKVETSKVDEYTIKELECNYKFQTCDISETIEKIDGTYEQTEKHLSYDIYGNLTYYNGNYFEYTPEGCRYSKNNIKYIVDDNGKILREFVSENEIGDYEIIYIHGKDGVIGLHHKVATKKENNELIYEEKTYLFQKNMFGDIIAIYHNNTLVAQYVYDAWGNHKVLNPDGSENENPTFIGNINPFRYRGYYYDVETQLYWVSSRYYSPELCRWISPDSIEYLDPESINGLNLYAYCGNDPVNKYDPTGHSAILIGLIIGAVIGFGAAAYIDYKDDGEIFNGSVKWYDYLGATVLGGAIGAGLGAFAGMSFSATLPTGFAMAQTSAGTMALVATGSMTLTVTGAEILGVAGLLGATYMFAKGGLPNNKHQNQQWAEAMRQLGIKDKDLWRRLHNEIHKHPYQNNLRDLLKLLREILQKWGKL